MTATVAKPALLPYERAVQLSSALALLCGATWSATLNGGGQAFTAEATAANGTAGVVLLDNGNFGGFLRDHSVPHAASLESAIEFSVPYDAANYAMGRAHDIARTLLLKFQHEVLGGRS